MTWTLPSRDTPEWQDELAANADALVATLQSVLHAPGTHPGWREQTRRELELAKAAAFHHRALAAGMRAREAGR